MAMEWVLWLALTGAGNFGLTDPAIITPRAPPPALAGRDLVFVHDAAFLSTVVAKVEPTFSGKQPPEKPQPVVAEVYVEVATGKVAYIEMKQSPSVEVSRALREAIFKWRFKNAPGDNTIMVASVVYYLVAGRGGAARLVPA